MPEPLRLALAPVLATIAALSATIAQYDAQVEALQRARYPVTAQLRQIPGVGPLTALTFVLLIDEPRAARSRDVGAYFAPRLDESSAQQPQLRISKHGDALGRRLLVSAAHYLLGRFGPPSALRRYGEALRSAAGPMRRSAR